LSEWRFAGTTVNVSIEQKSPQSKTMTRILIADDHEVVRSGLRKILESQPNWEVVAEVGDGRDAVSKATETRPDIAVLDYSLPLINGIEATRQIRARLPKTEVLIFTMHDNETLISELLKAGARGYLLKSDAQSHLIGAIECLALHKPFFTAKVSEALLDSFLKRPARDGSMLTNRERCVVQLIAEGHTNKQVATILNISLKTVETHRSAIMRKLNLSSSAGLVRYAIRNNIVQA
jgi:DNA-binding NarL/FixJ family response regulator